MGRILRRVCILPVSALFLLALPAHAQLNFTNAVPYGSGGYAALSVAVADVNGDGKPDLVIVNNCAIKNSGCEGANPNGCSGSSCDASVAVLLGNGDGTFQTAVTYDSGGNGASAVAVADVNGDGKLDLLVANQCISYSNCGNGGAVGVLLGNGDGTFQPVATYPTSGFGGWALAVADVNGDGKPDLLVTNQCSTNACSGDSRVGVLLGNGDGTFQPAVSYDSGGYAAQSIAIKDVNGDGKPDVLVANQCASYGNCGNGGGVGVLLGNGDGTFQATVSYSSGGIADSVAVGDVNGDGKPDLLVGNYCQLDNSCTNATSGTVAVLLGNGDGTFRAAVSYTSGGYGASSVAVADVNGDGKLDLLLARQCADSACGSNGTVGVLLGNGDGTFQPIVNYGSGGFDAGSLAVADVNGDKTPDLLVANQYTASAGSANGAVGVLLNLSGVSEPLPQFSPEFLILASTGEGTTSPPQAVTLTNAGNAALAIASIGITGGGAAAFAESNTCGNSLAPGANCSISVSYTPTGVASVNAAISISDNAPGSPQTIALTGSLPLLSSLIPSGTALFFPAQAAGTSSYTMDTLTNTGNVAITLSSIVIQGPNAAVYSQTNTCGTTLAAGASCQLTVTFTPVQSNSPQQATIVISGNFTGSPVSISISGSSFPNVPLIVAPSAITFPGQYVGTSGLPQTLTVTSDTPVVTTISSVTASPADFAVLSNCTNPLMQNSSCSIGVFFDPTASGTRTGTLTITDNAGTPQTVTLTGNGQDFSVMPGSTASATVAAGRSASYSIAVASAGGFAASVALSCSGGPSGSACAVSPSTIALTGAAAKTAMVTVTTAGSGLVVPIARRWPTGRKLRTAPLTIALTAMLLLMIAAMLLRRRELRFRWAPAFALAVVVCLGMTLTSCGGGSGGGGGNVNPQAGTYTIMVTGSFTSGSATLTHATKLTLVVQ
jgi:hypothetical protein